MSDALDEFEVAVLEESWEWIQADNLSLALKLEKKVKEGKTPEQLAQSFLSIAGEHREAYARRVKNAAKYLYAMKRQQA